MAAQYYEGIGRRKTATARVRITAGSGNFVVNQKNLADFFTRYGDPETIMAPFIATGENQSQYDVSVIVSGGGVNGQADAVQLGLARAFAKMNPDYVSVLRRNRLLTRDPREKERKKPGLKRARKAPTYTKR
ncbi:MAG TPA: 30S ribosomal protein S9 [Anaerolineaceae bacterium]|uniref:Small ribosomal subunit protein uS9 n=1 Tax=Anaerolinea thermophila TaxID=167964 RepID=A0A101FYQ8_9CHLR|nr:MAG: 30S ribosomal protein S9 [Anaerolinea thermophila]HAF62945.1 30S ribosomal protein S9 [Anaerolineaceae bacterium]